MSASEHGVEAVERQQVCPICHRTARVVVEPGQFGMETVTYLGHYVSDDYRADLCRAVGVPHVQPRKSPGSSSEEQR